jgi:membrane protease YdiL (CAAX protease family)
LKYDFKDRLLNLRRIRPLDVFVAVALPFAVVLTSILLSLLIGESIDQFALAGGASLLPLIIIAMILAPIMEETGWHGYGVDSLRAFYGMLKTTLLFGVLWSIWHAPLFFINGTYQSQLVQTGNAMFVINFFVSVIPAAVIANWLYYRNGRSITFAILFHAMLNGAAVLFAASQPAKCIVTVVYATLAIAIIAADRTFREGRRDFLDVASSTQ